MIKIRKMRVSDSARFGQRTFNWRSNQTISCIIITKCLIKEHQFNTILHAICVNVFDNVIVFLSLVLKDTSS